MVKAVFLIKFLRELDISQYLFKGIEIKIRFKAIDFLGFCSTLFLYNFLQLVKFHSSQKTCLLYERQLTKYLEKKKALFALLL